ncbi:MAG TPA: hypothetical protein VK633_10375, partial [Verrucomicrobiae bacterium]|nr:hypothetical protein [Verrucomicrobiae bacterium]
MISDFLSAVLSRCLTIFMAAAGCSVISEGAELLISTQDAGGGRSSSLDYRINSSISSFESVASGNSQDYSIRFGYTGSLNEPPWTVPDVLYRG